MYTVIIDITRKPLLVLPDEIASSIVVRYVGNKTTPGVLTFRNKRSAWAAEKLVEVRPDAVLERGNSVCYETRLLLPGTRAPVNPYYDPQELARQRQFEAGDRFAASQGKPKVQVLPDPFEVSSIYKDPITGYTGNWRVGIRVEQHKKLFVVTLLDLREGGSFLCTLAVKGLDPNPAFLEPLPLQKSIRQVAVGTAWSRIMESDD